jgi:esterase/lipase
MKHISDSLIYSPPNFDFSKLNSYKKQIIYIPKPNEEKYIPCLFVIEYNCSSNFLIYFHGNGEDIFSCELLGFHLSSELHMNIIIVEYPGYSIYPGKPDSEIILNDSLIVYDYIKNKFKLDKNNLFVCGRSLGSAPAIFLSSQKEINTLFLISAFESIKKVGKGFFAGMFFEDKFKSIDLIPDVTCNVLFIHGKNDRLISYQQSQNLYEKCGSNKKDICINDNMTHTDSDLMEDIINPIKQFFITYKINIIEKNNCFNINDPEFNKLFQIPNFISKNFENKIFTISNFSNLTKISTSENTCLLPISNVALIFSFNNYIQVNIYYNEKAIEWKEDENIIIVYLCKIDENTFVYLTNTGNFVIKRIDWEKKKIQHLLIITLIKPKKVIFSENENFYVLDDELFKIEIGVKKEVKRENIKKEIYNKSISSFTDILEIKKNIIVISSFFYNWLVVLDIEKNEILEVKERMYPIDKEHLYKLNENFFIIIETNGIAIIDSSNYLINYKIKNEKLYTGILPYQIRSLFIIDEDIILIGDNQGNITQFNFKTKNKINTLKLTSDGCIECFSLFNKKSLFVFIKYNGGVLGTDTFGIEIWRKGNNDKNDNNCYIY